MAETKKIINNPSITTNDFEYDEVGRVSAISGHPLAGEGGGTIVKSDLMWKPTVASDGYVHWTLASSATEPEAAYISGAQGPAGKDGTNGKDACPITATSTEIDDGVHVTISYTSGGNALTEFDIYDGDIPEFSANPINAHLLWKYSDDPDWTDLGFAMSGEKGPQGETGPQGLSGADGKEGPAGYSPQVTTASVNNDATHNNGGTEISITYKDDDSILTAKYTAWNGNNGEGATIALNGKDGIEISNNGYNYYAGLSADYLAAVQSVSSKLTKISADTLYQPIGTYALKSEIPTKVTDLTDSANYVVTGDILTGTGNKLTGIKIGSTSYTVPTTDLSNYYTKSETSGATEISTALGNKVDKPISLNNKYLVLRTDNDGSVSGWVDFNENVYSKSEADGRYQKKEDMSSYLTTIQYATDSATFATETELETVSGEITALIPTNYVTSGDYISGTKQYALTTAGWAEVQGGSISLPVNIGSNNTITGTSLGAIGNNNTVGEKSMAFSIVGSIAKSNSFAFGDENYASANSLAVGWKSSATDYSIAVGYNNAANINSVAFARDNSAYNYAFAAGHANTAINYSMAYGRGLAIEGRTDGTTGFGGLAIGGWNKTSANAILVLGNGTANTRSDALVVDSTGNTHMYRPMSVEYADGQNVLAVASAASLIGASRQTSVNFGQNTNALGTTWMGVGSDGMYRGFLKYTQGGNIGALDSDNTIQVEFTPSNKGQIFAKAKNSGTDCPETQILNPTRSSCSSMSTSGIDANNMSGPNYMIAKNADGQFVIGAAVYNCQTNLPQTLMPNTYYFVY